MSMGGISGRILDNFPLYRKDNIFFWDCNMGLNIAAAACVVVVTTTAARKGPDSGKP